MPEPLKFLDRIPAMTGGKEAVLAKARELVETIPDAAQPAKAKQKWAVSLITQAIKEQLRDPLEKLFDAHVAAIENEYILLEGDPPEDSGADADAWNAGLQGASEAAFAGDTTKVIGVMKMRGWVRSDAPTMDLVEMLLENAISDTANAFSKLGITPEDIEALIPKATTPDAPAPAAAAPARRHRSPKVEGPNALTEASKGVLAALKEHSGVSDADVAAALGVSRASIIGYRDGKTLWEPSEAQIQALNALVDGAIKPLCDALNKLSAASLE
jgi:hypothetical protein